jgi:hypothetical protein
MMASAAAASLPAHQSTAPPQSSPVGINPGVPQAHSSPADSPSSAAGNDHQGPMVSEAAAFQQRMDQFLRRRQEEQEGAAAGNADQAPEEYRMLASETSGSNSGDEDEREMGETGVKRLGSHFNGLSSKKRRKQSKPLKLGGEVEAGQRASPEPGEFRYRNPSEEDDLEEGEKRPTSDGPLNLSREEGEKPSLRVLGPELMNNPALLAEEGAKAGIPIPTSLYQGMLPFGLAPFPFPFPNQPPSSLAGKMPAPPATGFNAGGKPQIFNPEAYCGLCNKEFCNKYFLKTHKANKHGIYSDSPGDGNRGNVSRSPGPLIPPSSGASQVSRPESTSDQAGGPPTPNSQAGSPFSGAFIAASMGNLRPPFLPLSPGASPSPNSSQARDNGSTNGGQREGSRDNLDQEPPRPNSHSTMTSPREGDKHDDRSKDGKEDDLRKSLESPRSGSIPPVLPPNFSSFNPMMFGGLPSLEALRKEEEKRQEAGTPRSLPHIPNIPISLRAPQQEEALPRDRSHRRSCAKWASSTPTPSARFAARSFATSTSCACTS